MFLTLVIAFGAAFLVINPPLAVNDEDVHLARIYEIVSGRLTTRVDAAGEYHDVPEDYATLSAEYARISAPGAAPRVNPAALWQRLREGGSERHVRLAGRAAAYSPIPYGLQLLAVWLVNHFDVSALVHLYAARIASLITYVCLSWIAVVLSEQLQWIFIVVALTPIALTQATGVSADGMVNGLSLVFFALAGKAICTRERLGRKELWGMAIAAVVLTVCKPVYGMVLVCLPALFWRRSTPRWQTAALIASATAVAAGLYLGWSAMNPAFGTSTDQNFGTGRQLAWLREDPLRLPSVAYHTFLVYWDNLVIQSVFVRGRISNMIRFTSAVAVVLHLQLALGLAIGSLKRGFPDGPRPRRIAVLWFALCVLAIVFSASTALYLCCTEVGSEVSRHLQGRYFLPAVPPLLLACALVGRPLFARWLRAGAGAKAFAVLCFNNTLCLFTLIGFHYFPAGTGWPL